MGRRVKGKDKREERLKNYKPRNRQDNIILVLLKKKRGGRRKKESHEEDTDGKLFG